MNQYHLNICLPIFLAEIDYLQKRYTFIYMAKRFSLILFSTLSDSREKLQKGYDGVFFFISFSNSLNVKKVSSHSYVRLVKTLRQKTSHHDEIELLLHRPHKTY